MEPQNVPHYLHTEQIQALGGGQELTISFGHPYRLYNPQNLTQHHNQPMDKLENKDPHNTSSQVQPSLKGSNSKNNENNEVRSVEQSPINKAPPLMSYSPQPREVKGRIQGGTKEDEDQQEGKGYKELTMKLETALKKISHSKQPPAGKPASENENNFWRRTEECQERKKKQIILQREQSQKFQVRDMQAKPTINKNSEKIAKDIGHEPIYTRFEKLLEVKRKKEQEAEENKRKEKEEEQALFLEELNRHMRRPQQLRTYDKYYQEMVKWKERTNKHNRQKFQEKQSKEIEGLTFTPTLNRKSKQMVASQSRLPIAERGLIKKKVSIDVGTPKVRKGR